MMAGINRKQLLVLAVLFYFAATVFGCFLLVAAGKVVPF